MSPLKSGEQLSEATAKGVSDSVRRLRGVVGIAVGAAGVSLALVRAQDPTTAILLSTLITLALGFMYWIWRHIEWQDDRSRAQDEKIAVLTQHNSDCMESLHQRDVAIAALFGDAHAGERSGLRRESDRAIFHMVLGEDAARAEARALELRELRKGRRGDEKVEQKP